MTLAITFMSIIDYLPIDNEHVIQKVEMYQYVSQWEFTITHNDY